MSEQPTAPTSGTHSAADIEAEVERRVQARLADEREQRERVELLERVATLEAEIDKARGEREQAREQRQVMASGYRELSQTIEIINPKRIIAWITGGGLTLGGAIQAFAALFGG